MHRDKFHRIGAEGGDSDGGEARFCASDSGDVPTHDGDVLWGSAEAELFGNRGTQTQDYVETTF